MSYVAECKRVCEHCAAGNQQIRHSTYGYRHILIDRDCWADSEHVACKAPTIDDWAEAEERRIAEAVAAERKLTDRLYFAALDAEAHLEELRDAWERGCISEHDGQGGTRSNRNAAVRLGIAAAIRARGANP